MPASTHVLVHNVGHHDVWVILDDGASGVLGQIAGFYTAPMLEKLVQHAAQTGWDDALPTSEAFRFRAPLELAWNRDKAEDRLQLRTSDLARLAGCPRFRVLGVALPIYAPVLRTWRARKSDDTPKLVLITCSDVGSDDPQLRQTSTAQVPDLLAAYTKAVAPAIEVQAVRPIRGNPFQFGTLVDFTRDRLVPQIRAARRAVVESSPSDWAKRFTLTLSVSTGTTAVISSILAATREFRPDSIHVPGARQRPSPHKPFDAEVHPFETVDQQAPVDTSLLDPDLQALVEGMVQWRDHYEPHLEAARLCADGSELLGFWLRKGRQPVLAVVLVRDSHGRLVCHRATNLEVSLPTGTLCAERNAIGSALAANPGLRRDHLLGVAVLALSEERDANRNPLLPCGACQEWLK